jgi:hypothetical protein
MHKTEPGAFDTKLNYYILEPIRRRWNKLRDNSWTIQNLQKVED